MDIKEIILNDFRTKVDAKIKQYIVSTINKVNRYYISRKLVRKKYITKRKFKRNYILKSDVISILQFIKKQEMENKKYYNDEYIFNMVILNFDVAIEKIQKWNTNLPKKK